MIRLQVTKSTSTKNTPPTDQNPHTNEGGARANKLGVEGIMGITGWVCRMKVNGVNGLDGKLSVAVSKGTEYDMSIRRKGFRLTKKRYTERLWLIKQTR